jgi:hypothetical protein
VVWAPAATEAGTKSTLTIVGGVTVTEADWPAAELLPTHDWTVAVVDEATGEEVAEKLAVDEPAATTTVACTLSDEELLERFTVVPPAGAGASRVTVPVVVIPPVTEVGLNESEATWYGLTVSVEVSEVPESEAVSVTLVAAVTWLVVTVNVAVVAPAATFADELDDESVTTEPDGPAALPSVTVPVTTVGDPPTTDVGETAKVVSTAGVMWSDGFIETVPRVAVITAVVFVETGKVVMVKVAVVAPPGTVTVAGVTALDELELSVTDMPAAGAAMKIVTVPLDEVPPTTVVGLRVSPVSSGGLIVKVACWVTPA